MIDEEVVKNKYTFIKLLLFVFVIFLMLYISKETGLYEYKAYNKTKLTNESIIKFEKDISEGKNVSINDYVVNEYKDYSNFITRGGSHLNKFVESIMNDGIKKTLKVLSRLFYE